jgi:hypothetical protein
VQVTDSLPTIATQSLSLTFLERDTIAPTTPAALTAFAASCRQIDLTWGASTDNVATAAYFVDRRGGTNVCFTPITTSALPSFRDSGLTPGTAYQYRVQAADASGNLSPCSSVAEATTLLAPTVPPGLVAGYGFNEGTGTQTRDAADNGNIGNITGAAWTNSGKFGSALRFNGTNSLVLIPYAPTLNLSTGMTLEAWVYPTASQSGWRTIVQREADAYLLHAGNGNGALRPTGGGTFDGNITWTNAPTALALNTWTHLALSYDGTTLRLYANGTQSASKAVSGLIQTNTNPLRIGGNSPYGEYFLGRIDEVRVYDRPLGQTEIQADMNTPVEAAVTNTEPSISCLSDQVINENTVAGPLDFTVTDAQCAADNLTLAGNSSNPTLVPAGNIEFSDSGSNRTVTITPAADQSGTATIMLSVSDGQYFASSYFELNVNAVNDPPTISVIGNQMTTVNTPFAAIPFTIHDAETAAACLVLTAGAANTNLVPCDGIRFSGDGTNRIVTVTPGSNQLGTATITLTVSDGELSATNSFELAVLPAELTVTADNATRSYGAANPELTGRIDGLQEGDDITASFATTATTNSPVGEYAIAATLLDPDGRLGNYSVTTNEGTLTVTQATLAATADDQTRAYGQPNPIFTIGYEGFVNGEDPDVLDTIPVASTTATNTSPPGEYAITVTGGPDSNYSLCLTEGTLTITPPGVITITSAELTEAGHLRLTGTGDANVTYTVEASTDLAQWLDLGDATADEVGTFTFVDTDAADYSARFYRVILR